MNQYHCETCEHLHVTDKGMPPDCEKTSHWLTESDRKLTKEVGCASHSDFQSEQSCIWMEDDDGIYQTSCGNAFEFMNWTPENNHMKFCPYCGKLLRQSKDSEP